VKGTKEGDEEGREEMGGGDGLVWGEAPAANDRES